MEGGGTEQGTGAWGTRKEVGLEAGVTGRGKARG